VIVDRLSVQRLRRLQRTQTSLEERGQPRLGAGDRIRPIDLALLRLVAVTAERIDVDRLAPLSMSVRILHSDSGGVPRG
jgi:hypothetical protein